ncbi:MAG: endonuclease/exonuclease/phosphatase family protein [Bacteroidales bacterium]|nr:endonuclease/exonuclease/phosphatase family protein [Bacteroidales bacterium]
MSRHSIILLLLSIALIPSCEKKVKDTPKEEVQSLKVISFNMRYGEGDVGTVHAWENRREACSAMINDQSPDIFGVQEPYYYQIQYMDSTCVGYESVGIGRLGNHNAEHYSLYYKTSRISLLDWGTFWLSDTPNQPSLGWDGACTRSTTWALMKDNRNDRRFFFVNTHLDHVGVVAREKGLALILEKIGIMNTRNYPVILVGDFNMEITDSAFDELKTKMINARESAKVSDNSPTYHGWGTASTTIDFIWYSGFSECSEFCTIKGEYCGTQYISDHYPVYAIINY